MRLPTTLRSMLAAVALSAAGTVVAESAEFDLSGRTVTVVVGFGAGGGYDAYGRLAADHLGRFLPGNPAVVVENMPGGGGQRSSVYMATTAPKDGTVITVMPSSIAFAAIRGEMAAEVDPLGFEPIGRLTSIIESEITWHTSPTKTVEDARQRETLVASDGPRSNASAVVRVTNARFGTKFQLVEGYTGTAEIALAMERGEVEGMIHPLQTLGASRPDWLSGNKLNFLWQLASERHPDFPDIPALVEFATNDEDRALLGLLASQGEIGRSLAAPPGTPPEIVTVYRDAFDAMVQDPAFLADAATRKLPVDPADGDTVKSLIAATMESPADAIRALNEILDAAEQ